MLMKTFESRCNEGMKGPAGWRGWVGILLVFAVGCGPTETTFAEPELPMTAAAAQALTQSNGMSLNGLNLNGLNLNGLNLNGLNLNGLNLNGLNLNGLNLNGLSTTSFSNWFQVDPATRAEVMKYMVECAVPAGSKRTYTHPGTGTTYQWTGVLGLAPSWSGGAAATTAELQVVSACMAAHANKFGLHVNISLRGLNGLGTLVTTSSSETSAYWMREGCFFGNLFDGKTGVFSGNDNFIVPPVQSSPRVCALAGSANTSQCAPITYVGNCTTYCTWEPKGTFHASCTYNGVTYRPISTRINPSDIATCGNGVCEPAESCSASTLLKRCPMDCGTCS